MRKLPTHLKLLRGNPGKRPIRPEPEPSVPDSLPDPPAFLSEDAQNEWRRVAPELHRLGLLTVLDLMSLAAYCQAYAHWVAAERVLAGSSMANPLVRIARNAARDMMHFAGEFGMTPLARSRLSVAGRLGGPSKFGELLD